MLSGSRASIANTGPFLDVADECLGKYSIGVSLELVGDTASTQRHDNRVSLKWVGPTILLLPGPGMLAERVCLSATLRRAWPCWPHWELAGPGHAPVCALHMPRPHCLCWLRVKHTI